MSAPTDQSGAFSQGTQFGAARAGQYKNRGTFHHEELRRRRHNEQVELRKQKREESLAKRRNLAAAGGSDNDSDDENGVMATGAADMQMLQDLPQMREDVFSDSIEKQHAATNKFRRLLCQDKRLPPIRQVIGCGVVPRFVEFLRSANPSLQFEAAWVLTNIASGNSAETATVIDNGAIPIFIEMLSSSVPDVREQAVWALGNIAGDSPQFRNEVLRLGAMGPLLRLLEGETRLSMVRNATWTLSNFCRGKKPAPDWQLVSPALPVLARLLQHHDKEVLSDACWAISYLSDGNDERIRDVIASGVSPRLVELLLADGPIQTPALRSIGNVVTGNDQQTQHVINCGALPNLLALLSSPKESIRKEACWTISNITAGNCDQIQAVIEAGIIPPLIEILRTGDMKTKKEACWAISNASSGGEYRADQIKYLVQCGCIKPLCDLLHNSDAKMTLVALDGLEHILKVGEREKYNTDGVNRFAVDIELAGGMYTIERLQDHKNRDVYSKAYKIIDEYFNGDDVAPEDGNENAVEGGDAQGVQPQNFEFPENVAAPQGGFSFRPQ